MKFKHRYVFNNKIESNDIMKYLRKNNIEFEITKGIPLIVIEIFENNPLWSELDHLMKTHNIISTVETTFTKNEIKESKWLSIRTKKRSLYPQPDDDFGYESQTYDDRNYCDLCGSGLFQKDSFQLLQNPKWGNKNFLMINWVHDEIFMSNKLRENIMISGLQGFTIEKVKNFLNKQYLSDIFQLKIFDTLDKGMVFDKDDVIFENICPKCNAIKRVVSGKYISKFNHKVMENRTNDIYKSYEAFGDGKGYSKIIIISNRMYLYLNNGGYLQDFYVESIILV